MRSPRNARLAFESELSLLPPFSLHCCARRAGTPSGAGRIKAKELPESWQPRAGLGAGEQGREECSWASPTGPPRPSGVALFPRGSGKVGGVDTQAGTPQAPPSFQTSPHQRHPFLRFGHGPVRPAPRLPHRPRFLRPPLCFCLAGGPCIPGPLPRPLASHRGGGEARVWGAWPGGAGLGGAGPRAGARGGGGQLVDRRYWSRSASRAEAAARGGGSWAGRLHGASGACLSSAGSGRRRPDRAARLLLIMGDVLSTHLDDARRQHIAGESGAAQLAAGVRRGASRQACWGLRRVRPRAGREWPRAKTCCPRLFLLRLGAPSWLLLSPPFPLPRGLELPPTPGSRRVSGFPDTVPQSELWKRAAASPLHLGYLCPEAVRAHSASVS